MKNKFGYVVAVALGCMLSSACKEEMVPLYADDGDGVYFNYGNKDALNATVNFADPLTDMMVRSKPEDDIGWG